MEKKELEKNLSEKLVSKNEENLTLQKSLSEFKDLIARFSQQEEKIQNFESVLKEKDQTILQMQLKIKEMESLFEKRIEINRETSAEQNREAILKFQKEKEIQLKVTQIYEDFIIFLEFRNKK